MSAESWYSEVMKRCDNRRDLFVFEEIFDDSSCINDMLLVRSSAVNYDAASSMSQLDEVI